MRASPGWRKILRVVGYEYRRHVLRRGFLFALLSVPLMVVLMALVVFLLIASGNKTRALGYVDQAQLIQNSQVPTQAEISVPSLEMIPYPSEESALKALQDGEIQVYFLLPEDYLETGRVQAVFFEEPGELAEDQFREMLRANLISRQAPELQQRLRQGSRITVLSADGSKVVSEDDWFNIFLPVLAGLAFIVAIFITSGYLMQAVVEEKENRTIEILVTSTSPTSLMVGKVVGISLVGFTQIMIWVLAAFILVLFGSTMFPWLAALRLTGTDLLLLAAIYFPAYLLVASLMAAIGATVTEVREGQQVTGIITLIVVIPYWFFAPLVNAPNSPLSIGLSFFPLTAPVALSIRLGFGIIPPLQLAVNILVLIVAAAAGLWLAGRAFRIGMLRYGKRLPLWKVFQVSDR